VLASGSGTLLDAICAAGVPVAKVLVDRVCAATDVADRHSVANEVIERTDFSPSFDRAAYTAQTIAALDGIDLVVMAGWGTIFSAGMFEQFGSHILNTHPALLPSFPGWHAVRDALAYGVKVTGCTVHVATLEVDAGPILAQEAVPVLRGDDEASLHERIKGVERRLYPETIMAVLAEPTLLEP
jgi:phosphoribosylglycinamide formyltransferase-1